jgi:hypothetical protein
MTNTQTDSQKPVAPLSVVARHPVAVLVASTAFVRVTQVREDLPLAGAGR